MSQKKKHLKKKKRKTLAGLIESTAKLIQRYRRYVESVNGYCRCVTCGTVNHWRDCDGGHWIPRVKTVVKLMEWNIWPQCRRCNNFDKEFAKIGYNQFMLEMFGQDFIEYQYQRAKYPHRLERWEVEEIYEYYREELNKLGINA